ncbi:MAG: hypothetical protein KKC55_04355 [Gammaproteobacteria bacterium]|nr:hypothetical protein [Gammaproteobacteria bacterium]
MTLQLGRGRKRFQRVEHKPQLAFIKKPMNGAMTVTTNPDAARAHFLERKAPLVRLAAVIAPRDQVMKLQGQRPFAQRAVLRPLRHRLRP